MNLICFLVGHRWQVRAIMRSNFRVVYACKRCEAIKVGSLTGGG